MSNVPAVGTGAGMMNTGHEASARLLSTKTKIATLLLFCIFAVFNTAAQAQTSLPTFSKAFSPNTIGPGSTSRLVFSITNGGTIATLVAFSDTLPAGMVIADPANLIQQSCSGIANAVAGGSIVSLFSGRLAAFQSCTVAVNVTSSTPGTHTNVSGDLTSNLGNSGSATADLTVATDRPGFSKSFSPASVSLGDRSTLTFTIDNTANTSGAFSASFTDSLPAPMVVANPNNAMNSCSNGTLTANAGSSLISYSPLFFGSESVAAGSVCTISVDVLAAGNGSRTNTSSVLSSTLQFGQALTNGFATANLNVDVSTIHLTKTFIDDPVAPGGTVELAFNISNRDRGSEATNIAFTDDVAAMLAGLVAVGLPASDVCGTGSTLSGTGVISLSGGTLAGQESCDFSITLQVPENAATGGYTNLSGALTADLAGSPFTGNMASDTLFVDVGPVLSKTFLSNPAGGGDTVSIEFTVSNASDGFAASDITFVDNISEFISGSVATGLPQADVCGVGSSLNLISLGTEIFGISLIGGELGAGASCTFSADIVIPVGTPGGVQTNITDPVSATINGSTRIGNAAQASLTILETPELTKLFIDDPVAAGGTTTLQFTITNPETSTTDAIDISFTDDLDATLSGLVAIGLPATDVCGTGSILDGTSNLSFTGGNLLIGESCTFSVTLSVPASALPGSYDNQTSDLTANLDGVSASGTGGADSLTVAGLDIAKSFPESPIIAGATTTMEFILTNTSTLDATSIFFTDDLGDFISGSSLVGTFPQSDVCGIGSTLSLSGNLLILTNGTLLVTESCTIMLSLLVPAATEDGSYPNLTSNLQATVDNSTIVLDPGFAELEVNSLLIELRKAFADASVSLGSTSSLDFTITNLSATDTITNIAFSDDLDAVLSGLVATGLTGIEVCGAGSSLSGTDTIVLTGGSLAPGVSCSFSVDLIVPAAAEGVQNITNVTSDASGLVGNLAVEGAPATASAIVVNVNFEKVFENPAIVGDTTTLTFTIENNGETSLDRLFFTDDLEAVLSGLVATGLPSGDVCGTGSLLTGTSIITLTGGALAAGASCQFSVTLDVPADAEVGNYENTTSDLVEEEFRSRALLLRYWKC